MNSRLETRRRKELFIAGEMVSCDKHGDHYSWSLTSRGVLVCLECRKEGARRDRVEKRLSYLLACCRYRSKKKGMTCTLTDSQVTRILKKQGYKCAITRLPFSADKFSLDRIDSTKGYTEKNVQVVLSKINLMKHSLSMTEFIYLCTIIVKEAEHGRK